VGAAVQEANQDRTEATEQFEVYELGSLQENQKGDKTMTNNQVSTETTGAFLTNPQLLSAKIVKQYLDPSGKANDEELAYFIATCKERNLNPFTKEVYFIKYGTNPAQVVVSKDAFMKRAEQNPNFDGFEAGIVVETAEGEIKHITGTIHSKNDELLGGWAKVYRKDRSYPIEVDADFKAYNTGKSMWSKMPALMIRKVALVSAMREAFSENVGGLYTADEMEQAQPIDVTPKETRDEVMKRKQAQIEQMKQEQPKKEVEPVASTEYTAAEEMPFMAEELPDDIDLPFT
jgi:phage recombination protein bet